MPPSIAAVLANVVNAILALKTVSSDFYFCASVLCVRLAGFENVVGDRQGVLKGRLAVEVGDRLMLPEGGCFAVHIFVYGIV